MDFRNSQTVREFPLVIWLVHMEARSSRQNGKGGGEKGETTWREVIGRRQRKKMNQNHVTWKTTLFMNITIYSALVFWFKLTVFLPYDDLPKSRRENDLSQVSVETLTASYSFFPFLLFSDLKVAMKLKIVQCMKDERSSSYLLCSSIWWIFNFRWAESRMPWCFHYPVSSVSVSPVCVCVRVHVWGCACVLWRSEINFDSLPL